MRPEHGDVEPCENNVKNMAKKLPPKFQVWVEARKRFHLSHAHVQMARELGLNPKKLGSIANHDQEKWKSPLPQFIEALYFERFGNDRPESVLSIEELLKKKRNKKPERDVQGTGDFQTPGTDEDLECPF